MGFDEDGLPYGIEFMAPTNREDLLFEIAIIHEKLTGVNINPEIAPPIYEIPNEVNILVQKYLNHLNKELFFDFEKEWLGLVKNYFRNYSQNANYIKDAIKLTQLYENNLEKIRAMRIKSVARWSKLFSGTIILFLGLNIKKILIN